MADRKERKKTLEDIPPRVLRIIVTDILKDFHNGKEVNKVAEMKVKKLRKVFKNERNDVQDLVKRHMSPPVSAQHDRHNQRYYPSQNSGRFGVYSTTLDQSHGQYYDQPTAGNKTQELEKKIYELEVQNNQLQQDLYQAKQKLQRLNSTENENQSLKSKIKKLQEDINTICRENEQKSQTQRLARFQQDYQRLEMENHNQKEEIHMLKRENEKNLQSQKLEHEYKLLRNENKNLKDNIEIILREITSSKEEPAFARPVTQQHSRYGYPAPYQTNMEPQAIGLASRRQREKSHYQPNNAFHMLPQLRTEFQRLISENTELKENRVNLEILQKEQFQELQQAEKMIQHLTDQDTKRNWDNQQFEEEIYELQLECQGLRKDNSELKHKVTTLTEQLLSLEKIKVVDDDQKSNMEQENYFLKQRIRDLEHKLNSTAWEKDQVSRLQFNLEQYKELSLQAEKHKLKQMSRIGELEAKLKTTVEEKEELLTENRRLQVEAERENTNLKSEIEVLQRNLSLAEVSTQKVKRDRVSEADLTNEIEKIRQENRKLSSELRRKQEQLTSNLNKLKAQDDHFQSERQKSQEKLLLQQGENWRFRKEIKELKEEKNSCIARMQSLERQLEEQMVHEQEEIQRLLEMIEELKRTITSVQGEKNFYMARILSLEKLLQETKDNLNEQKKTVHKERLKNSQLQGENSKLENQVVDLLSDKSVLKTRVQTEKIKALKEERKMLGWECRIPLFEDDNITREGDSLEKLTLMPRVEDLKAKLKTTIEENKELKAKLKTIIEEKELLLKENKRFQEEAEWENESLKSENEMLHRKLERKRMEVTVFAARGVGDFKHSDEVLLNRVSEILRARSIDIKVMPWQQGRPTHTPTNSHIHVYFCINTSRLGTDVDAVVDKYMFPGLKKSCVVIFHHKPPHNSHVLTPSKGILSKFTIEHARAAVIIDCVYWGKDGFYECQTNDRAIREIVDYIQAQSHW